MEDPKVYIPGGRRCALQSCPFLGPDWFVGVSPRNGMFASVEGPWEDWVTLAKGILAEDERRRGGQEKGDGP